MDLRKANPNAKFLCCKEENGGVSFIPEHPGKTFEDIKKEDFMVGVETKVVDLKDLPPYPMLLGWRWNGADQPITVDMEEGKSCACEYLATITRFKEEESASFAQKLARGATGPVLPEFEKSVDTIVAAQTAEAVDQEVYRYMDFLDEEVAKMDPVVDPLFAMAQTKLQAPPSTASTGDTSGAEDLMKLSKKQLMDLARTHHFQIPDTYLKGPKKDLAELIAKFMNAVGQ